jgi:hypothetical protein
MFFTIVGIVAGFIGLIGYLPYFITIIKGKTKPNRATWFVWGSLGFIQFISYCYSGSKIDSAIWLLLCYTICQIFMAILSVKYGEGGWDKLDRICLAGVLFSIFLWRWFDSASVTLLFTIAIDIFGAIPTVKKSYSEPEGESAFSWTIFLIANSLNLVAIDEWAINSAYPFYLFCLSLTLAGLLNRHKIADLFRDSQILVKNRKIRPKKNLQ